MVEIINVLQVAGDPVGGTRKHVHTIIRNIDQSRFRMFYVYSSNNKDLKFNKEIVELESNLGQQLAVLGRKRPAMGDIINIFKIANFIKKNSISVVHGHGAKGGLYARAAGWLTGIPSVYTPHGGSMHSMFNRLTEYLYISVEKLLAKKTSFLVFESKYSLNRYREKVGDSNIPCVVNYSGVDIEQEKTPDINAKETWPGNPSSPVIGVIGALRKEKGQITAIRALEKLYNSGIKARLLIVGDGRDREGLEKQTKLLNLNDLVEFVGEVENVAQVLGRMDIVVISSYFESFGYVAIEAMANKIPVIASNVGGLKEIIRENETGWLVEPGDPDQLAKTIVTVTSMAESINKITERAYSDVERRFNVKNMVQNLENIYIDLYSKKAGLAI